MPSATPEQIASAYARERTRVETPGDTPETSVAAPPAGGVLFAAAEGSRRRPIERLGADFVSLYRTRLLAAEPPQGDVVVLASGSAARAYAAVGGQAPAVSIGPQTSTVAESVGLTVAAEAETHDLDGLVAAVDAVASRS